MQRHLALVPVGRVERFLDARAGGTDHLQIDPEFATVIDHRAGILRLIGIEHRGNVVLGVTCGKQHARHRQNAGHALGAQPVETVRDHRIAEFEIAVFHRNIRIAGLQPFGDRCKLARGVLVAAAMATDHDAGHFGDPVLAHDSGLPTFLVSSPYRLVRSVFPPWPWCHA
jgi:hypothetical protein